MLSFIQCNLNHTKAATAAIFQYMKQQRTTVALLQDAYINETAVRHLFGCPMNWRTYHSLDMKAWLVFTDNTLLINPQTQGESSVFVALEQEDNNIIIGSQYAPPLSDLEANLKEWEMYTSEHQMVIGGGLQC